MDPLMDMQARLQAGKGAWLCALCQPEKQHNLKSIDAQCFQA